MQDLSKILSQPNPPLRQRRQRTSFTEDALQALEEIFKTNPYPDINEREIMAREFKTTEDRIQVWFQNKRARFRKRMHKENGASQTKIKSKSTKSTILKPTQTDDLEKSPIRKADSTFDNQINNFMNSTPVSLSSSINTANFSFNNSLQMSLNDSGYSSNNYSQIDEYYKYGMNLTMSHHSPLFIQSTNTITYHRYQYPSCLYNSINLKNYQSLFTDLDISKPLTTHRAAKSVFRPFE